MRWLWKPFSELQEALEEDVAPEKISVSRTASKSTLRPKQINDHVYEVHEPTGMPSVELVFFHGLQLEPGSSEEAHMTTWVSRDKSEFWLTWLLGDIPEARILTISYDAAGRTTKLEGRGDMYLTGENLVYSLTGDTARVGQNGCPVVLVGHCLGGLVMKEVCIQAFHMIRPSKPVENFLENLKGLFFYATPHHGSLLADYNKRSLTGPLIKALETLEEHTARRNEEFRQLRILKGWKTFGVGELLPVKLKLFHGIMVPEASARSDMDFYYGATVDHYNICRPVNKQSSTYQILLDFIHQIVKEVPPEKTQEEDLHELTIPLSRNDSGNGGRLGPRQLWVLRQLLVRVRLILFPLIVLGSMISWASWVIREIQIDKYLAQFQSSMEQFQSSMPKDLGNNVVPNLPNLRNNRPNYFFSFGIAMGRTMLLLALIEALFKGCVYLLELCITKRWAHPQEVPSEVNLHEVVPQLDEENSKLVEVGGLQQEGSRRSVESRDQDDLNLETEPLLLEQQSESKVEVHPLVVPIPLSSRFESQIDVYPSLEPSKETRRLRSRGANTNKFPIK